MPTTRRQHSARTRSRWYPAPPQVVPTGHHGHGALQVDDIVKVAGRAHHCQYDVIPGDVIHLLCSLFRRVQNEYKQNDKAQKQAVPDAVVKAGKQVHPYHEQGKESQHDPDDQLRDSGPDPGVGFAVVLLHDRFHVLRRSHVYTGITGRSRVDAAIFQIAHYSPP